MPSLHRLERGHSGQQEFPSLDDVRPHGSFEPRRVAGFDGGHDRDVLSKPGSTDELGLRGAETTNQVPN
jgi:hypothetical protein